MSEIDTAYQPNPVPTNSEDLAPFLYEELYRISAALEVLAERIEALEQAP